MNYAACRVLACLLALVVVSSRVSGGTIDDLAPCVVFLVQDVPAGSEAHLGSGFLVRDGDTALLVTAAHVASELGPRWRVVMPGRDGKAVTATATGVGWRTSEVADVAVALFAPENPEVRKSILGRCLPLDLLTARPLPPERDVPLTVMGYPLGLGSAGYVSPLALETRAASGFLTLRRADNGKDATFVILEDPSIGGLSGGPVFDTGKMYFEGKGMKLREGVSLVGLIHGVISDKSGGKLAAVVPATEIVALIRAPTADKK